MVLRDEQQHRPLYEMMSSMVLRDEQQHRPLYEMMSSMVLRDPLYEMSSMASPSFAPGLSRIARAGRGAEMSTIAVRLKSASSIIVR